MLLKLALNLPLNGLNAPKKVPRVAGPGHDVHAGALAAKELDSELQKVLVAEPKRLKDEDEVFIQEDPKEPPQEQDEGRPVALLVLVLLFSFF